MRKPRVALLAEGVDRNYRTLPGHYIEQVALLAEGVDRNATDIVIPTSKWVSPSSRRAWIEIGW